MARNVAILLFDEVEVLDFAGPFEIFAVAGRRGEGEAALQRLHRRRESRDDQRAQQPDRHAALHPRRLPAARLVRDPRRLGIARGDAQPGDPRLGQAAARADGTDAFGLHRGIRAGDGGAARRAASDHPSRLV